MPAGGKSVTNARKYGLYTGESYDQLRRAFIDGPAQGIRIAADLHQQALEANVLNVLSHGCGITPHPFGIKRVQIDSDGVPILWLDDRSSSLEHSYRVSELVVQSLLPSLDALGGVAGIPHLRVEAVDRLDLHLKQLDSSARIVLRGSVGTDWGHELEAHACGLQTAGFKPLWLNAQKTSSESSTFWEECEFNAWLGSGLLRRIGLFHTVSFGYETSIWTDLRCWKAEIRSRPDLRRGHDALVEALSDPELGLSLQLIDAYCRCEIDSSPDRQCTFTLVPVNGPRGELTLRFPYWGWEYRDYRSQFEAAGADRKWLDRVLPLQTSKHL